MEKAAPAKPSLTKRIQNWYRKSIQTELQKVTREIKKNLLAFLAFLISIGALTVSIFAYRNDSENYTKQGKQWNAINLARISVTDAKFFTFRAVTFEEMIRDSLQGIKDPNDDDNNPSSILIKNLIVAYDTAAKDQVPFTFAITKEELTKDLYSKKRLDTHNFDYKKMFRPQFTIQNVGQTSCTVNKIYIHEVYIDTANYIIPENAKEATLQQTNFTLEPGQKFISSEFTFNLPITVPIPKFDFKCDVYYTDINGDTLSLKTFMRSDKGVFWIQELYNSAKLRH